MKKLNDSYVEGVLKRAIAGVIGTKQAARNLGVSKQYVNKLKRRYAKEGAAALRHGNCGKSRAWKTDPETEAKVIGLYKGKYADFNFSHFVEKLGEDEGIPMTYPVATRILAEAGLRSPKRHKNKGKKKGKHPSRPRKERFGEMLQIDASLHAWFGDGFPKATLHGAIDDATGIVMGLHFDREETLDGYYRMCEFIFSKYGIPACFYGDNRTIFEFRKLSEKGKTIDRDVHVQFKRMCQMLGIELITTSVSEAKGRIERLWETLQSRLISELRLRGIKTIAEANAFLPSFMADFNRRFAFAPDMENSLFAPAPSAKEIDFYLSVQYKRVADNGSCVKFNGERMALFGGGGELIRIAPKGEIDIYRTLSGKLVGVWDGGIYELSKGPERESEEPKKKTGRPKWIPPKNHPWRKFSIKPKNT